MKTFALGALLALVGGLAAADPIEGLWQTEPDDGAYAHIRIAPCAEAYCGTIEQSFNADGPYQSENHGKMLVIDMVSKGGNAYEGKVWRPSNDKVYLGKITLDGDNMTLKGCVAGGLFCAAQAWTRVE